MDKKIKYILKAEGFCKCRVCGYRYNLEDKDDNRNMCLCGLADASNDLKNTEAEIVWKCPECGYKNKDIKPVKIGFENK